MKSTRPHRVTFKANGKRVSFTAGAKKRGAKRTAKKCTCSRGGRSGR